MSKHKKHPYCKGCYPDAFRRSRRSVGYSPPYRCEAHAIKNPQPPKGPAAATRAA